MEPTLELFKAICRENQQVTQTMDNFFKGKHPVMPEIHSEQVPRPGLSAGDALPHQSRYR
jgi:hypothetical protein